MQALWLRLGVAWLPEAAAFCGIKRIITSYNFDAPEYLPMYLNGPSSPRTSGISSKLAIRIPHHRHITYNNLILHLLIHRILLSQGRDTLLTSKEGEEYERILTAMYTRSGTRAGGARTNWQQAEAPADQHVTTQDGT